VSSLCFAMQSNITFYSKSRFLLSLHKWKNQCLDCPLLHVSLVLPGKPHVQLLADEAGNVWYVSNYNGIFMYNAGSQSWSKVAEDGVLSIAADGSVINSYEVTPTTQVSCSLHYIPPIGQAATNPQCMASPTWTPMHGSLVRQLLKAPHSSA
jgi:hypothetical protein